MVKSQELDVNDLRHLRDKYHIEYKTYLVGMTSTLNKACKNADHLIMNDFDQFETFEVLKAKYYKWAQYHQAWLEAVTDIEIENGA